MKLNTRIIIYFFVLLVFCVYEFSANYIFNVLIRTENESELVKINLPPETGNVKFNVEQAEKVNLKWKEGLSLKGWVLKDNNPRIKREVYLVLKSEHKTLVFTVLNDSLSRPDVIEQYHFGSEFALKGFETILPSYLLKEDSYKIGFVVIDDTGEYFTVSNLELVNKSGDYTVVDLNAKPESAGAEPDPELVARQVTVTINKATKEINYYLDSVGKSRKYLTVRGWGFLDGLDSKSLKSYVLLKKNRHVFVFDVKVQLRKDITSHFTKTGYNLDSTGFQSVIPFAGLEKGSYQLGLYFSKDTHTGIVYTNQFIEIGN